MAWFFTSDTHWGHRKMAQHRGFGDDTEAMNETLVKAWNRVVTPKDTVYHLGDMTFMRAEKTAQLVRRLNGSIKLVPGNHDTRGDRKMLNELLAELRENYAGRDANKLEVLERLYTLKVPGTGKGDETIRLELCHFPMLTWDRAHYRAFHLHGHSHGFCRYPDPDTTMLDVGVDHVGMSPISLQAVLNHMASRRFHPCDLHDPARYEGRTQ